MVRAISTTTISTLEPGPPLSTRGALALAFLLVLTLAASLQASPVSVQNAASLTRPPRISPDYQGLVIPPNIAPLNFLIQETGTEFQVTIHGAQGLPVEVRSSGGKVVIPDTAWRKALETNKGADLLTDVYVRGDDHQWSHFTTLTNHVAREDIDPVLLYRKLHPVHNTWGSMGIYQRDLRTFEERPLLENQRFGNGCCHCHTLRNNNPNTFTVDIRSQTYENSLVVVSNGVVEAIKGTVGFVAWHPTKPLLVGAFNKPRLMLHTVRREMLDIAEMESWIGYMWMNSNVVFRIPGLSAPDRLIGFPTWAPDGRYLYYCESPSPWTDMAKTTALSHKNARYDLMRIPLDDHDQWGKPEIIVAAKDSGFSAAQPRVSPDGRWLFFCAIGYGCWPVYDAGSDLYGIDLQAAGASGKFAHRKLELNSSECESMLTWSSNSRWVVFSSKRASPLFNRPHISYVSPDGECKKPFVLPQQDPSFYESYLKTYTFPQLATGPVTISERELVEAVTHPGPRSLVMPAGATLPKPEEHP